MKQQERISLQLDFKEEIAVLRISGKLFTNQISLLQEKLDEALKPSYCVVVDLSELDYICSSGVGALVNAYKSAQLEGGNLILASAGDHIKRIFSVIGFSKFFEMSHSWADSVEEGISRFLE